MVEHRHGAWPGGASERIGQGLVARSRCDEIETSSGLDYLALGHVHVHGRITARATTVALLLRFAGGALRRFRRRQGGRSSPFVPESGVQVEVIEQISVWGEDRDAPSPHGAFNMTLRECPSRANGDHWETSMSAEAFRAEARDWLEDNCPDPPCAAAWAAIRLVDARPQYANPETKLWLDRMAERGWTAPHVAKGIRRRRLEAWPKSTECLPTRCRRINAAAPLSGHGLTMIGPGDSRVRHPRAVPRTPAAASARGEIRWCQGYSEPGAGSDLASLQMPGGSRTATTIVVNGSKIWTSGRRPAQIGSSALVRTDLHGPQARRHLLPRARHGNPGRQRLPHRAHQRFFERVLPDVLRRCAGAEAQLSSASLAKAGRLASGSCNTSAVPSAVAAATPGKR